MDSSVCLSRKKNIELSVPHVENKVVFALVIAVYINSGIPINPSPCR